VGKPRGEFRWLRQGSGLVSPSSCHLASPPSSAHLLSSLPFSSRPPKPVTVVRTGFFKTSTPPPPRQATGTLPASTGIGTLPRLDRHRALTPPRQASERPGQWILAAAGGVSHRFVAPAIAKLDSRWVRFPFRCVQTVPPSSGPTCWARDTWPLRRWSSQLASLPRFAGPGPPPRLPLRYAFVLRSSRPLTSNRCTDWFPQDYYPFPASTGTGRLWFGIGSMCLIAIAAAGDAAGTKVCVSYY
jgi:hypothetical protein